VVFRALYFTTIISLYSTEYTTHPIWSISCGPDEVLQQYVCYIIRPRSISWPVVVVLEIHRSSFWLYAPHNTNQSKNNVIYWSVLKCKNTKAITKKEYMFKRNLVSRRYCVMVNILYYTKYNNNNTCVK